MSAPTLQPSRPDAASPRWIPKDATLHCANYAQVADITADLPYRNPEKTGMDSINRNQRSDATMRAIARVQAGAKPTHAAQAEGVNSSTLFRALAKERPQRLFLLISPERGGFNAWVEDQRYRQRGEDEQFATIAELQAALPRLLTKV